MKVNEFALTEKNSSPDLSSLESRRMFQTNQKLIRRPSVPGTTQKHNQYTANQRRQTLAAINNNFLSQNTSSSFSVPLLINTMNTFHQTAQVMEEEIMLPLRLRDLPVEELVFDSSTQPDNWHEIYTFIQEIQNQLRSAHPFAEDDEKDHSKEEEQRKYSNDDEGIILSNYDNNAFSSASSTVSSEEYEQNSTSSVGTSYDTIKDELKCHYYGLFRSLDNLTSLANRVTEKYREECN